MTMKRTLAAVAALTALLLSLLLPASAAEEKWRVASAYCQNDTLYTYTQIPEGQEDMEVSLNVGQSMNVAREKPERVSDGDTMVHCLLLIDLSTSMVNFCTQIQAFAGGLLSEETQPVRIDIAGIGSEFTIIEEGLSTRDEVLDALSSLQFRQTVSDISGGVRHALQYLAEHPQQGGTLLSMVLLTDGIPYSSKASDLEAEDLEIITRTLQISPEIIVHTVGLAKWEPEILAAFSGAAGGHHEARTNAGATDAGKETARFTDGLYRVIFPLDWPDTRQRIDAKLLLTQPDTEKKTMVAVPNIRNLDLPLEESEPQEIKPVLPAGTSGEDPGEPEETPPDDTKPEGKDPPADGEPPVETPEDGGETKSPGDTPEKEDEMPGAADPAGQEEKAPADEAGGVGGFFSRIPLPWLIGGGAFLLVLAVVIVILCTRSKGKKQRGPGGIAMRLDIRAGQCKTSDLSLSLISQLTIGSDRHCDVVFPELAPLAAKITLFDNMIYLEEVDPQAQAAIGGMRIHGPNRLRSGDEVSLGAVQFRLLF